MLYTYTQTNDNTKKTLESSSFLSIQSNPEMRFLAEFILSKKKGFLTEPALSRIDRFLAALEMTSEGFGMTKAKGSECCFASDGNGLFDLSI